MLVKIKVGDKTLQFDSRKVPVAILLDDSSKQAIDRMKPEERLVLSAPVKDMQFNQAEVWKWAYEDWEGASMVAPPSAGVGQEIIKRA